MFEKRSNSEKFTKQFLPSNMDEFLESIKDGFYGNTDLIPPIYSPYGPRSKGNNIIVLPDSSRDAIFTSIPKPLLFFILNSIYAFPNLTTNWVLTHDTEAMIRSSCISTTESNTDVSSFVELLTQLALTYSIASKTYMDLDSECANSAAAAITWITGTSKDDVVTSYAKWCDLLFRLHYRELLVGEQQNNNLSTNVTIINNNSIILIITRVPYSAAMANSILLTSYDFHSSDVFASHSAAQLLESDSVAKSIAILNSHLITIPITADYSNYHRMNGSKDKKMVYFDGLFVGMIFNNYLDEKHPTFKKPYYYNQSCYPNFIQLTRSAFALVDDEVPNKIIFTDYKELPSGHSRVNYLLDKIIMFTHESIASTLNLPNDHPSVILGFVIGYAFDSVSKLKSSRDLKMLNNGVRLHDIILDMSADLIKYYNLNYLLLLKDRFKVISNDKLIIAPEQIVPTCTKQLALIKSENSNGNIAPIEQLMIIVKYWINLYANIQYPYTVENSLQWLQMLPIPVKSIIVGRDAVYVFSHRKFNADDEDFGKMLTEVSDLGDALYETHF